MDKALLAIRAVGIPTVQVLDLQTIFRLLPKDRMQHPGLWRWRLGHPKDQGRRSVPVLQPRNLQTGWLQSMRWAGFPKGQQAASAQCKGPRPLGHYQLLLEATNLWTRSQLDGCCWRWMVFVQCNPMDQLARQRLSPVEKMLSVAMQAMKKMQPLY